MLSIAGFIGSGLLLVSCGNNNGQDSGGTAQPIGTVAGEKGIRAVNVKEVALNNGVLYLLNNPGPFTGMVNDKWPDGSMKYQCVYTDGLKDGPELSWHENGKRKLTAQHKANVQEGQRQEWWNNGNMKRITPYSSGKPHGEAKGWHENGRLARIVKFEEGLPVGKSEGWWENGARAEVISYVNGKPDNYLIKWFPSGKTNQVTFNRDGVKHGTETTWYPNGQKKMQVNFVNGKANGDALEWHSNSQQLSITKYVNGAEHGPDAAWYSDGKVWLRGAWNDGQRDQLFTMWHSNGVKKLEMEYNAGILRWKKTFNINGQVTENTVIPPGRTIRWTEDRLTTIQATRQQIQQSFGKPDKIEGQAWVYSGIHIAKEGKTQKVTINISFSAVGSSSNVSIRQ